MPPLSHDNPYAAPGAASSEPPVLAQPVEESDSVLRVDYQLTLDDLVEFNLHHHRRTASLWRYYLGARIAVVAIVVSVPLLIAQTTGSFEGLLLPATIAGAMLALLLYNSLPSRRRAQFRQSLQRMLRDGRNVNLFGPQRCWLSPTGVRRVSRYVDTTYQWPVVERIDATPHGVYIYDSAASAILVPRSAFAHDADFDRFLETARQFWRAST